MKWSLIQKIPNPRIEAYGHAHVQVKEFIRKEGGLRCVYCCVHENALGGVQAFHIDHYKPKKHFPALINSLGNLFYSCPICNRFKSDDWPANPSVRYTNSSYPDPSKVDYSILFDVNYRTGLVQGLFVASKYIVERLYFNRPQLILERKRFLLDQELASLVKNNQKIIKALESRKDRKSRQYLADLNSLMSKLVQSSLEERKIPSYEIADVTKPKKRK